MAAPNLKTLDVASLLALRADIDKHLSERRKDLEKQLSQLEKLGERGAKGAAEGMATGRKGRRPHSLKGRTIEPKYRDPDSGATWAGRGAKPVWLRERLENGASLEQFLINPMAAQKEPKAGRKRAKRA